MIDVEVRAGDIAAFDGDAVVNAANNHLVMGAGVAGALARRGGPEIQRECDEHVRRHGPLSVGQAALTAAGDLPARWVIHAAAMGDEPATARSIRSATRDSLRLAAEHELASLAFPVLGSGIAGFPFDEAARIMLDEIRAHAAPQPTRVVFYGYTREQADALRVLVTPPDRPSAAKP